MSHRWDPESYQSRLESKRLSATGAKDLVDRLTQTRLLKVEGQVAMENMSFDLQTRQLLDQRSKRHYDQEMVANRENSLQGHNQLMNFMEQNSASKDPNAGSMFDQAHKTSIMDSVSKSQNETQNLKEIKEDPKVKVYL